MLGRPRLCSGWSLVVFPSAFPCLWVMVEAGRAGESFDVEQWIFSSMEEWEIVRLAILSGDSLHIPLALGQVVLPGGHPGDHPAGAQSLFWGLLSPSLTGQCWITLWDQGVPASLSPGG